MKLMSKVENGTTRIDFDPSVIKANKLEEINNFLKRQSLTSKVTWLQSATMLKRGIVVGYYNKLNANDNMAQKECAKVEDYIKKCAIEED